MKRIITVILLAFIVLTGLFLHAWKTASAAAPQRINRTVHAVPGQSCPAQILGQVRTS
ncbi:MAG TPA: hypothetical protein VJQ26_13430 [Ktedonobacteraceae bacterium]|nr:hypothetical protein [Ktedonobacteraceae bacterium]